MAVRSTRACDHSNLPVRAPPSPLSVLGDSTETAGHAHSIIARTCHRCASLGKHCAARTECVAQDTVSSSVMQGRFSDVAFRNWPGYRVLFTTRYIFGTLLPFESIGYLYREAFKVWKDKHSEFAEHGVDIISGVSLCPR